MSRDYPGEFEQMVMLAILRLGDDAHAPGIGRLLEDDAGRRVPRGQLYSALARLERKAMVKWAVEAGSESGGHSKRVFEVTGAGRESLRLSGTAFFRLWRGLEGLLSEDGE